MENRFEKARNFFREGNFEKLDALISEAQEAGYLHPDLLLLKAWCFLTAEPPFEGELSEVETWLDQAASLNEQYFLAYVERGYLKLNVMDDAEAALPMFDKAIELINRLATEAIIGKAKCLAELKSEQAARSYIEQARQDIIESDELEKFLDDVNIYTSNEQE